MRIDNYLVDKGFFDSRTKAKQAIERNEVYLNGKLVNKVSLIVDDSKTYDIKHVFNLSFVSLGGYKLNKAITDFNFNCNNLVVADIGASTGGFTDCLIKNGAKKVFAVDLNDELLHNSLKSNDKVKLIVKNAKNLVTSDFSEELDLIVADLSFISINSVINVFSSLLNDGKHLLVLIKPQFEIGEKVKYKNGIVKDKIARKNACIKVYNSAIEQGFSCVNFTNAPIVDGKNVEYLMLFIKNDKKSISINDFDL